MQNVSRLMTLLVALGFLSVLYSEPLPAQQTQLQFDPAASQVTFELDAVLHKVHGTARLSSGSVRWQAEGTCAGDITIDATSLESGNAKRDRDMHRKVLHSDRFKSISFSCRSFDGSLDEDGVPTGELSVKGDFSLHGEDHPMTVVMTLSRKDEQVTLEGTFQVPYVAWGLTDPSKVFLRVGKEVEIQLQLTGSFIDDGNLQSTADEG